MEVTQYNLHSDSTTAVTANHHHRGGRRWQNATTATIYYTATKRTVRRIGSSVGRCGGGGWKISVAVDANGE